MNIAKALDFEFTYTGKTGTRTKKGSACANSTLEWFVSHGTAQEKEAAKLLLAESFESNIPGAPAIRVPNPEVPEVPPDDGFGPPGVHPPTPPVMPKALVPAQAAPVAPKESDVPEWAKRLQASMDNLIHEFSRFEVLFDVAERMAKAPATHHSPNARGGGDKPVLTEHATRAVLEHKEDGRVRVSFWDDDKPNLKYSVLYATKTAKEWGKLMPWLPSTIWAPMKLKDWVAAFPDFEKQGEVLGDWTLAYTESDRKNEKGNPYKDLTAISRN